MFKTFKLFLVLALMVSFTALLSGNTVLAGTQLDLAGFHNGEAVKFGNKMLERGEKRDLVAMIKYATETNTEVEGAIIHAFKEGRSQLENVDYNIEDSTVQHARDEYKQTGFAVGKYVNELTNGSWHLKKAISSAKRGEEKVAMLHASRGMALLKQCQIDLKSMGANRLQRVPDDYDLTAAGIEISY
ncbi:MAG: hypothetical protein CMD96_09025 [Gammaproteobacteria bacterium]|jgi:exonuclease VII small subunit|nr:hypothetical protein [Gammaproteobacteria bacterium]HJP19893.1 hypothetical protein [Nitrospinota bacterium]|tara:strand:- start:876 stop:1436 length:561 start_codon:yes stop_codon:yes gene_type:complete